MRLVVLIVGVVATVAAVLTAAAIALMATERGRAATATVAERVDPQVTQVRRAIEPGVQSATQALRRIPIVGDRVPAPVAADEASSVADAVASAADAASDTVSEAADAVAEAAGEAVEAAAG